MTSLMLQELRYRQVATELLPGLDRLVADAGERVRITAEIRAALARPPGTALRPLLQALGRNHEVHRWVRLVLPPREDVYRSDVPDSGKQDPEVLRYLAVDAPDAVLVGQRFPLHIAITRQAGDWTAAKPFPITAPAPTLQITVVPRGLIATDDTLVWQLPVPPASDSPTITLELYATEPGTPSITIRAADATSALAVCTVPLVATAEPPPVSQVRRTATITDLPDLGVSGSLVLQVDEAESAEQYWFRLGLDGKPLAEQRGRLAERAVQDVQSRLTELAGKDHGKVGLDKLKSLGTQVWLDFLPADVREELQSRLDGITSVTVVSDLPIVPWELMLPTASGQDVEFIAGRLPVMRQLSRQTPVRTLCLDKPVFGRAKHLPVGADDEINEIRRLLGRDLETGPDVGRVGVLYEWLTERGFDVFHLASHHSATDGDCRVEFADADFRPSDLYLARGRGILAGRRPLIFLNVCSSLGDELTDTGLPRWTEMFLAAGAGTVVGTGWAVNSKAAQRYAVAFYDALVDGAPLGEASVTARSAVAGGPADPTRLAYAVYGHPAATVAK
jgi:hypothetical protein